MAHGTTQDTVPWTARSADVHVSFLERSWVMTMFFIHAYSSNRTLSTLGRTGSTCHGVSQTQEGPPPRWLAASHPLWPPAAAEPPAARGEAAVRLRPQNRGRLPPGSVAGLRQKALDCTGCSHRDTAESRGAWGRTAMKQQWPVDCGTWHQCLPQVSRGIRTSSLHCSHRVGSRPRQADSPCESQVRQRESEFWSQRSVAP